MALTKAEVTTKGAEFMTLIVGNVIKRHRTLKYMSQAELEKISGTSKGYITKIERGIYDPSVGTLAKIARALGIPLWQIFKEAEEEMAKED